MNPGAILLCLVVSITDGDTLKARCDGKTYRVRLAQIDAPERKQPFGTKSKQYLSDMCYMKQAKLLIDGNDRYGRLIADVGCEGKNANIELVRSGMAWVYPRYAKDKALYSAQDTAKAAKLGLWGGSEKPVPPWKWRRKNNGKH